MKGDRNHTIEAPSAPNYWTPVEKKAEKRRAHRRDRRTAKQLVEAQLDEQEK